MMSERAHIREIQQELLVALKEFHQICIKNDIKYSLHAGTLIGAVREQGFIPWDDDVDVAMTRQEYEKILDVTKANRMSGLLKFCVLGKVSELVLKRKARPCVFIDIFVYDGIAHSKFLQKLKCAGLMFLSGMLTEKELFKAIMKKNSYGKLKSALYCFAHLAGRPFSNKRKYRWYAYLSQRWLCGDGRYIHRSNDRYCGMCLVLPESYMRSYEMLPFEDTELMVSTNWHELLVSSYGEDYMTPKKYGETYGGTYTVYHQFLRRYNAQNFVDD